MRKRERKGGGRERGRESERERGREGGREGERGGLWSNSPLDAVNIPTGLNLIFVAYD